MSAPYIILVGIPQDEIICRILDVTPCRLANILRDVTSKKAEIFLINAVKNTSPNYLF